MVCPAAVEDLPLGEDDVYHCEAPMTLMVSIVPFGCGGGFLRGLPGGLLPGR